MSSPSISIFSERSSPSTVRFAAPNTGAPLTAAGRSGGHAEMRGKAASGSRGSVPSLWLPGVRLSRRIWFRFYAPVTPSAARKAKYRPFPEINSCRF
jgi:hypothetical protein